MDDILHREAITAEPKILFDTFGLFVAVLVGIELLRILRHLLQAHEVNTTLVVQTALIALCNITSNAFALPRLSWRARLPLQMRISSSTRAPSPPPPFPAGPPTHRARPEKIR